MKKVFRIFTVAVRALLLAAIALLLIYNIYTLIARYAYGKNIPTIFGFGCAVVETGSMEPSISAGDLIFIQEKEQYFVGDIITFFDSSHNEYVTHRIIFTCEQRAGSFHGTARCSYRKSDRRLGRRRFGRCILTDADGNIYTYTFGCGSLGYNYGCFIYDLPGAEKRARHVGHFSK